MISGLYRGQNGDSQLELRVDIDGNRPTGLMSGDLFASTGATTSYVGSFVVTSPLVSGQTVVAGQGVFTYAVQDQQVSVTISEGSSTASVNGRVYPLTFASPFFRSVLLEQDSVVGTVPFISYDTGRLPGPTGSPPRRLGVKESYAEAGIEIRSADGGVVPVTGAGADLAWDDSELHNVMVQQFSGYAGDPGWRVWMLVASRHVGGYRGIMFDYNDQSQRQGAAVFYDAISGASPQAQRAQLRTYVHELGHAFNLLHSWQKNLAIPPQPLGPNGGLGDLSWMNYVQNYRPGGEPAYWAAFPFQFTDSELAHLRHGFFRDVVMGANAFGSGAAEIAPFEQPVEDTSGLRLTVRAKSSFGYGEPVVVELRLGHVGEPRSTHNHLHPDTEFTQISITQPSGRTVLYRPMMRHCVDESPDIRLDAKNPAMYRSAYIGHGHDGHYFQQPGLYRVRAQYIAADGSRIASPPCVVRVRHPVTVDDEQVAALMLGEEQGKLFSLLGSDSPSLREGNEALDEMLDRHGSHPLAVYARLVKGLNAAREFKTITKDRRLTFRPPRPKESILQLGAVAREGSLDNITLNMVMRRLAHAEAGEGDVDRAFATLDSMVRAFEAKKLSPIVLGRIRQQAALTKEEIDVER